MNTRANSVLQVGYPQDNAPDPFAFFLLDSQVAPNSNVFAFQKAFAGSGVTQGGKWGFDVYYERVNESDDAEEWTCEHLC
jgi:hypothetical protein